MNQTGRRDFLKTVAAGAALLPVGQAAIAATGAERPPHIVLILVDDMGPGEPKKLEETRPEIVEELVNDLAKALHDGRTTPGEKQKNEGWPYLDGPTAAKFPQLKEK